MLRTARFAIPNSESKYGSSKSTVYKNTNPNFNHSILPTTTLRTFELSSSNTYLSGESSVFKAACRAVFTFWASTAIEK